MAILFSACVSYSVMHVFVCLLEQYDVTSVPVRVYVFEHGSVQNEIAKPPD